MQSKRKCFTEKGSWQGIHKGMEKVMNKDLWAYGQYQSDTKIEEKVKVDSQGMARQAD